MGGGRAPLHHSSTAHHHAQSSSAAGGLHPATAKKGSVPNGHIQQYIAPNTIYSLQQAAGANYNSLSLHNGQAPGQAPHGNHTLNYLHSNGRSLMVTKEDHNIEDIHVQMVFKIQREKRILE